MKYLLIILGTIFSLHFLATPVLAVSEFSTDFRSDYLVSNEGEVHVTHQIRITNNLSHIYTTEYSLVIGSSELGSITASSGGRPLPLEVVQDERSTSLKIKIPHPAIGLGGVTTLDLTYSAPDIVTKIGKNWEINIPRLSRANEASYYSRRIILPNNIGEPTVITPNPTTKLEVEDQRIYEFVGYSRESISLLFGQSQAYLLDLTYHLKNATLGSGETELALPPDTPYQQIVIDQIEPPPDSIRLDADGNWLATYYLKSQEQKTVRAKLYANISPLPIYPFSLPSLTHLTKPSGDYWQSDQTDVKLLAAKLKDPQDIYSYLVTNLTYDYTRVGEKTRLGAAKTLANPTSAICTEYTDTFIALSRAVGFPVMEVNGYAYTSDPKLKPLGSADTLHAWPMFYHPTNQSWRQADPTWGSTTGGINYFDKLDYSHIAFVLHGLETTYPIPAGAYKENETELTVKVEPVSDFPLIDPSYKVTKEGGKVIIEGVGNAALHDETVEAYGEKFYVSYLPPRGKEVFSPSSSSSSLISRVLNWFKMFFTPSK